MRPHVRHLDAEALPWAPIFKTGALRRTLNTDPVDRSFTSFVSIPKGWRGPSGAHIHSSFEEALVVEGSLTLDGEDYLTPESYLYRPGFIVHGWDERSDQGSLIIIKRGGVSDIIGVGPRLHDHEYIHKPVDDGRPHIVHLKTAAMAWSDNGQSRLGEKTLSLDRVTGARTFLIRFPNGWQGSFAGEPGRSLECVVVSGGFALADGTRFDRGHYFFRPAPTVDPPITASVEGCVAMMWSDIVPPSTAA